MTRRTADSRVMEPAPRPGPIAWITSIVAVAYAVVSVVSGSAKGLGGVLMVVVALAFAAWNLLGPWLWNRPLREPGAAPTDSPDPARPPDRAGDSGENPALPIALAAVILLVSFLFRGRPGTPRVSSSSASSASAAGGRCGARSRGVERGRQGALQRAFGSCPRSTELPVKV
jgi:hypothetical protein